MDYNKAIESVCFKFGHAVTEYDVFRWLRNFDESEWTMALNVLDKVVYYSSDMIDETLEYQINMIIINIYKIFPEYIASWSAYYNVTTSAKNSGFIPSPPCL